jgi:hypothetical protein
MSQNTSSTTLAPLGSYATAATTEVNFWQLHSINGERLWNWIAWAFTGYWVLFVSGAFLENKQLNSVGGLVVLAVLGWAVVERLWVRVDAVVLASLALGLLPAIQVFGSTVPMSSESVIKHVSLCLVMALPRLLRLPVVSQLKVRRILAAQILVILFISLTLHRGSQWDGGRYAGLFVNPNNLALIPFLLLLLIDQLRDSRLIQLSAHAVVIIVLGFTTTSGAVVAYGLGLAVYLSSRLSRRGRAIVCYAGVAAVLLFSVFFSVVNESVLPDTRITKQIFLMRSEIGKVIQGEDIEYYQQEKVLGSGTGSALWRVQHWRDVLMAYGQGTPVEQIFGFGPGSSVSIVGKLPHNEYLRMLFEEGLVGLVLFLFAWYRIIRTAPPAIRYVALIVAVYSLSENNLDNFPFMALFALCLSANVITNRANNVIVRPTVPIWAGSFDRNDLLSPCR